MLENLGWVVAVKNTDSNNEPYYGISTYASRDLSRERDIGHSICLIYESKADAIKARDNRNAGLPKALWAVIKRCRTEVY